MNSDQAFEFCRKLTAAHYENFPVGSALVPRARRKHVWAIYAFARTADDFADEGRRPNESEQEIKTRLDQLDDWEKKLDDCTRGVADNPVFIALSQTLSQLPIPVQLLRDLLTAYRMDVQKKRHEDFDALLHYCRYSANPVGRLVLHLFDYNNDQFLFERSDDICSALQLANFWQDVSVDLQKDRIYIPQDFMQRFNVSEQDLLQGKQTQNFCAMMRELADLTLQKFNSGLPLCSRVGRNLKLEMRATWLGGVTILRKVCQNNYSVLAHRPVLKTSDKLALAIKILLPRALKPLTISEMEKV